MEWAAPDAGGGGVIDLIGGENNTLVAENTTVAALLEAMEHGTLLRFSQDAGEGQYANSYFVLGGAMNIEGIGEAIIVYTIASSGMGEVNGFAGRASGDDVVFTDIGA